MAMSVLPTSGDMVGMSVVSADNLLHNASASGEHGIHVAAHRFRLAGEPEPTAWPGGQDVGVHMVPEGNHLVIVHLGILLCELFG